MRSTYLSLLALTVATSMLAAQSTVKVGGAGAFGCQDNLDPPKLSNGTLASADYEYTYDAVTGRLTLRVTNTSPVTPGVPNPLITTIAFNMPAHAVTGLDLVSQTGSSGATPAFGMTFDADLFAAPNPNKLACAGDFSVLLSNGGGASGGIANANADTIVAPIGSWVVGPVTFVFQLSGPGVAGLNAGAIANALSQNASGHQATAAAKFQSGGRGGEGSGFIGSAHKCVPGLYSVGAPRIGQSFDICAGGAAGCLGCVLVSPNPGPTQIGNWLVNIGLPLLHTFVLPPSTGALPSCTTLDVPDNQGLIGLRLYFLLIIASGDGSVLEQSDRLEIVIQ